MTAAVTPSPARDLAARWRRFKLALLGFVPLTLVLWLLPIGASKVQVAVAAYLGWLWIAGGAWVTLTRFTCPRCNKPYFGRWDNVMALCCENCLRPLPPDGSEAAGDR